MDEEIKIGFCDKCGRPVKMGTEYHVVKIIDKKSGKTEWRCNKCVRSLSEEAAHKLTGLDVSIG